MHGETTKLCLSEVLQPYSCSKCVCVCVCVCDWLRFCIYQAV